MSVSGTELVRSFTAAPPAPPVPRLSEPLAPEALVEALRAFHSSYHAEHPFHRLMNEGKLTRRQLQGWVANRLAYQLAIPRKDAAILSNCPDIAVRRRWIQRIIDHDGTEEGSGGIEMWLRMGEAMGLTRDEMLDGRHVLPGVRMAAEAYVTFCRTKPWVEGCASSLTELFAPDLMRARLDAFPRYYGWMSADGLAYFRSRLTQAPRDVTHGLEIVTAHCTTIESQTCAFEALAFKLDVLWVLIDAIHQAYREAEPGEQRDAAPRTGDSRGAARAEP